MKYFPLIFLLCLSTEMLSQESKVKLDSSFHNEITVKQLVGDSAPAVRRVHPLLKLYALPTSKKDKNYRMLWLACD